MADKKGTTARANTGSNRAAAQGRRWILILSVTAALLIMAAGACILSLGDDGGPPRNAAVVEVTASTSLGPWLEGAVSAFNDANLKTGEGDQAYVQLSLAESGQATADIAGGDRAPDLWLPEGLVWTQVLADQGEGGYVSDCQEVASSPLVIAMWREAAESMGWPGLPFGWLDIGSLAADPAAWAYFSGGEFGESLRLGHTHPGLSGSGVYTLLALVQAAQSSTDAVSPEDIGRPIVQASVTAFEAAVATFSTSSAALIRDMVERGPGYLGASVMYESDVLSQGNEQIVPIYPLEGTFLVRHPACIRGEADAQTREAARLFRDYLLGEEGQRLATEAGLRPPHEPPAGGGLFSNERGVALDQPALVFSQPMVESVYAVQELWQSARKPVNLVMLLDVSGSMRGNKINRMREAAEDFIYQMGDDDIITLVAFSDRLVSLVVNQQVGPARGQIVEAIRGLQAGGDTALYDAIGLGARHLADTTSPETTNALVVLSDGQDTYSREFGFGEQLINLAGSNDTTVMTIAYGDDADEFTLSELAIQANGNFFRGDEASIAAIYEEMSAAFGGAVGFGR
jgi:Ca-activated chloride channel homolog